jgi:hypothetical protein
VGTASSHADGICLSPTIFGDDIEIIKNGEYTHPRLVELTKELLKRKRRILHGKSEKNRRVCRKRGGLS